MTDEDHRQELRIWLRLFASTTLIENEIRSRLRERFAFTLPRFDLLAQLDWADDGLSLGEVSRRLMVSAANITSIVEKLVEDGYITGRSRTPIAARRSFA
jgi:DNA-binding MarR family transcriptional regulator